jgi:hypothetical protein
VAAAVAVALCGCGCGCGGTCCPRRHCVAVNVIVSVAHWLVIVWLWLSVAEEGTPHALAPPHARLGQRDARHGAALKVRARKARLDARRALRRAHRRDGAQAVAARAQGAASRLGALRRLSRHRRPQAHRRGARRSPALPQAHSPPPHTHTRTRTRTHPSNASPKRARSSPSSLSTRNSSSTASRFSSNSSPRSPPRTK